MAEREEGLKSLLMMWKRRVKNLASNSTFKKQTSWHPVPSPHGRDGETVETVTDFIFGGSKITTEGDCSHEIKRHLLFGRKSYDQPRQHMKKQRHYFANKGLYSQSYGFSTSYVWIWEELMLLNCGVGKDSWGSLGVQGDPTSPFWRRSALGFLWKEWC